METFRLAGRRWKLRPGFTAMVVVTLSLGIAVTTAIFSVVDTVLLRPLAFSVPSRLVAVHAARPGLASHPGYSTTWNRGQVSMGTWDLLQEVPVFEAAAGWSPAPTVRLLEPDPGRLLVVYKGTSNLLPVLGVRPATGRPFRREEDEVPNDSVLLSYALWRDLFGGDPTIVGRNLTVALARAGGFVSTYEIVGVLPEGFTLGGRSPDLMRAPGTSAGTHRTHATPALHVIARLSPAATLASAQSAADAVLRASEIGQPTAARVLPLSEDERRAAVPPARLLLIGATVLLVLACVNVSGLLLADARRRHPEMALRVALGGQTRHLVRQLAAELVIVAGAGVAIGLILSHWLVGLIAAAAPSGLRGIEHAGINLRVAAFAILTATGSVLISGFAPMLELVRVRAAVVTGAGRAWSPSSIGPGALVAAQAAFTFTLLVCATVLAEALFATASVPLGFNARGVVVVSTTSAGTPGAALPTLVLQDASPAGVGLPPPGPRATSLLASLEALPDVVNVSASSVGPFSTSPGFVRVQPEGAGTDTEYPAQVYAVTESYFETMQIPVLAGRTFERDSRHTGEVIVSREFARRYLGPAPVGSLFYEVVGPKGQGARFRFRVIGVVGDVKQRTPSEEDAPVYYQRSPGDLGNIRHLVVRTSGDTSVLTADIKRRLGQAEPGVLVTQIEDLDKLVRRSLTEERFRAFMSAMFAGAAVILAMVGFHVLTIRRISERRHELGVRVALGASVTAVRLLVMRSMLRTVGLGLAAGVILALLATVTLEANVNGVRSASSRVLAQSALSLGCVASVAVVLGMRRITASEAARVLTGSVD